MNKKIFEIAGKNTSELAKLTLCWKEAQKELLEKIRIEYLTKVNGELRYKELIKSLSLENIKK